MSRREKRVRCRRLPAVAVILAGGRSRRMGRSKASLRIGPARLLDLMAARMKRIFGRVYVAHGMRDVRLPAGTRGIRDLAPGQGPLAGLYAGFARTRARNIFLVACDMPLVPEALIRLVWKRARSHAAAVPCGPRGAQPLCAFYARKLLPEIRRRLESADRSVHPLARARGAARVSWREVRRVDPEGVSFRPMNTPGEWRRVRSRLLREMRRGSTVARRRL